MDGASCSGELAPRVRTCIGQAKKGYPSTEIVCDRRVRGISNHRLPTEKVLPRGFRTVVQLPSDPPTKKELLSTKSSFFVYPSRRLGISSPREAWCISSRARCALVSHQPLWGWISLRLDDIQHFVLVIYNASH